MSDIQDLVAENRERIKTTEATFVEVGTRGKVDLSFGQNAVNVDVTIEVYKRDLNNGLYSGHPNGAKHGSGNGVSGDVRGPWNLVESSTDTVSWTRTGRNAVRDVLNGETGAVSEGAIGTGTSDATSGDTALDSKTKQKRAFVLKDATNVVRGRTAYGFATHDGSATEYALYDKNGRLLTRVRTDDVNPTNEEEVRVGVILTVNGSGQGNSVVTDDGEEAVADALQKENDTVGLLEFAYGSGTAGFSKSDSSLTTEEFRKDLSRTKGLESLRTDRPVGENTGSSVDLSELGIYDNKGRLVWATTFTPFTYDSETTFSTTVGFLFS